MNPRPLLLVAVALGALACQREYELRPGEIERNHPPAPARDDVGAPIPVEPADPADDPALPLELTPLPLGHVPAEALSACDPDAADVLPPAVLHADLCRASHVAGWTGGALEVDQGDEAAPWGVLTVERTGWYDVYGPPMGGASDAPNQSAWLRVPTASRPFGEPLHANCDQVWVAPDLDGVPHPGAGMLAYMGTFRLQGGDNDVQLRHYCELYDLGGCTWPHVELDGATCADVASNPVQLDGASLCVIPTLSSAGRGSDFTRWGL